jgi:hypothetical protein
MFKGLSHEGSLFYIILEKRGLIFISPHAGDRLLVDKME